MSATRTDDEAIVIRHATEADARTLIDLALLDERAPLSGPALIAEVGGVARAALDLQDGGVAADPFARTAELVEMLRLHARGTRCGDGFLRRRVAPFLRPISLHRA